LKADLHRKLKDIEILDITHQIRLNNIIEASFVCKQLQIDEFQNYIVLVKLGPTNEYVVYQHLLNLYIFPNNGLISMVFPGFDRNKVKLIETGNEDIAISAFLKGELDQLDSGTHKTVMRLNRPLQINGNIAAAECIFTDAHGNCYFNISKKEFEEFTANKKFNIRIQHYSGHEFDKVSESINETDPGEALFRFSRRGYLKLQINMGNARQLFRIKDETKIIIELQ
jgi:S-adenosylmethionine hydrolase